MRCLIPGPASPPDGTHRRGRDKSGPYAWSLAVHVSQMCEGERFFPPLLKGSYELLDLLAAFPYTARYILSI